MNFTFLWTLDENHQLVPCNDPIAWGIWFARHEKRVVAFTDIAIKPEVSVSTVFIGTGFSFDERPPILFETMVFGGLLDGTQVRYRTWKEAEAGHVEWVQRVQATLRRRVNANDTPD